MTRAGRRARLAAGGRRAVRSARPTRRGRVVPLTASGAVAVLLAAVLLAASLLGGLAAALADSPSPSPSAPVLLRVGWAEEPDTLSPYLSAVRSSRFVWDLVYDTLVDYDAETLEAVPGLAASWDHSADGLVWTFTLRDGVRWQDGRPLTARDVAWTYAFALEHDVPLWRGALDGVREVEAVDDRTVRLRCSRPKADLLDLRLPVLPAHVWGDASAAEVLEGFGGSPPLVGSGAFRAVAWRPGQSLRLEANETYWGGRPVVDDVVVRFYAAGDALADDLEAGRLDGAWGVAAERFEDLDGGGRETAAAVTAEVENLVFNCAEDGDGHPALRDAAVRRALAWAVDRERLAEVAYGPAGEPAGSLVPAGLAAGPIDYHRELPEEAAAYDPERAVAELDAAGYPDADGDGRREDASSRPLELRLVVRAASPESVTAAGLIAGWFGDLGVTVEVEKLDDAAFAARVWRTVDGEPRPDFDLLLWGWRGDVDPGFVLSTLTTSSIGTWNPAGWSSKVYDELFREQARTLDAVARRDLVWRMQDAIAGEAPVVPVVHTRTLEAYDTRHWSGWTPSPGEGGGVVCGYQIDSYLRLRPQDPGVLWGLPLWAAAALAAAALGLALALAVVLWRRARR
ncbi:MAG TPA: peptide ABC transporter substrate-binding protein [Thermoleophilia bacterium]|nr:peptide ABC transporter substrate-binding protein [Thermoleophilia bacterium]